MEPKTETSDQITAGYHGTSRDVADEILRTHFKLSAPDSGAYLGEGVYFFENQPSQARHWAITRFGLLQGSKVAVIQSKIRYGKLLNLTDKENYDSVKWFAQNYERKARTKVSLPAVIDIVAEQLHADVVKAIRIPRSTRTSETGFSADIEVILAVREIKNILSKEIIWSQMM
jgi:hypothetical protein